MNGRVKGVAGEQSIDAAKEWSLSIGLPFHRSLLWMQKSEGEGV